MKVSKSGLFLFELIVVIFLFTVSSAVCISIFANSFSSSTDSENLTKASLKAQTVAEIFKDNDGNAGTDVMAIADALNSDSSTHDIILSEGNNAYGEFTLNLYYDNQWSNTDEVNKAYILTVTAEGVSSYKSNNMIRAQISITDEDKTIFDMTTYKIGNDL